MKRVILLSLLSILPALVFSQTFRTRHLKTDTLSVVKNATADSVYSRAYGNLPAGVDTTALSNRINLKISYSDTSAGWFATRATINPLLAAKVDTASRFQWSLTGQALAKDSLRFIQGANITLTQSGNTLSIAGAAGAGEANTASNLSGLGIGIWKDKSVVDLRFKRLKGFTGITIADSTDSVAVWGTDTTALKNGLLKNADSTTLKNSLLKNADSTSIRNYSSALYLKNADSTTLKNSLLKNADSTSIRNYSSALYLKNADSTSIRNYSNALYGDITSVVAGAGLTGGATSGAATLTIDPLSTGAIKVINDSIATMVSTSGAIKIVSDSLKVMVGANGALKIIADSLQTMVSTSGAIKIVSDSLKVMAGLNGAIKIVADSLQTMVSAVGGLQITSDSLKIKPYGTTIKTDGNGAYVDTSTANVGLTTLFQNGLKESKSTIRQIFNVGLVDSVKTSDTVQVGWVYPGATVDTIRYSGGRSISLTARLELVDSLYQVAGMVLVDTTTVRTMRRDRAAAVSGGTFTLTATKMLRMVFPVVGTMPKQFNVSILGHY